MANQGFGQFAGSFAESFAKTMALQQENQRRNKESKLLGDLAKLRIENLSGELEAGQTIDDLIMGRGTTVRQKLQLGDFDEGGIGTFAQTGEPVESPRRPMDLASALATPEGQAAGFQLGLGQSEGQPSAFTKDARLANIFPGTPEYAEAFKSRYGQDEQAILSAELMASIQEEKVLKARGERVEKAEENRKRKARGRVAIRDHFILVNESVEIMRDLQKTVVQSGIPGGDQLRDLSAIVGAFQEFFGADSPQAKIIAGKRDRLQKLFAETLVDSIKGMKGIVSAQRERSLLAALPTIDNLDIANAQVFGDQMRGLLSEADIEGFIIGGRDLIEKFIADPTAGLKSDAEQQSGPSFIDAATNQARSALDTVSEKAEQGLDAATVFAQDAAEKARPVISDAAEKARTGLASAKEIAKLTLEDLKQIDKQTIADWTDEQRVALDKRLKELGI